MEVSKGEKIYVKETYVRVQRRKRRRKHFPMDIFNDDNSSSFSMFEAFNAENIKKYKAEQKYNIRKKVENLKKCKSTVKFDATPVDLKTVRESRKKDKDKKQETKRKGDAVPGKKKFKFFQPEVKAFCGTMCSPNTTFDRLLRSSRKPLVDKNSMLNVNNRDENIKSGLLSPVACQSMNKGGIRTSTPIFISPIFPAVGVCTKRSNNICDRKKSKKKNLISSKCWNSIASPEASWRDLPPVLCTPDSIFSTSPYLCNGDVIGVPTVLEFLESDVHNSSETEYHCNKIVDNKCDVSFFSPAVTNKSSAEIENVHYKNTDAEDSIGNISGATMRLRRNTGSRNEICTNINSSVNRDESFFSSVNVRRKRGKKTENRCNNVDTQSYNFCSPITSRSKRNKKVEGDKSDKKAVSENLCNKNNNNCNMDKRILSSVKHKGNENRCHKNFNDQNLEKYSSLSLDKSQDKDENGKNCVDIPCDIPHCDQPEFRPIWQSPDMFSSADEVETDLVPSKCIPVTKKCNSSSPANNSNDEGTFGRNMSSTSIIADCCQNLDSGESSSMHSYNSVHVCETEIANATSPVEIKDGSLVIRKSVVRVNSPSQIGNKHGLTISVYASPLGSVIASSVQSSDHDKTITQLCADKNKLLQTNFDNCVSGTATESKMLMSDAFELKGDTRNTQNYAQSCSDIAVLATPSHVETYMPKYDEVCTANIDSQEAHQAGELKNVSSILCTAADIHNWDYCGGQSLMRSVSLYTKEKTKLSCRNPSYRSSLCRRLSHVMIPERRKNESSGSNESLPIFDKRSALSVAVIDEDDELMPEVFTFSQGIGSARDMVLGRCNQSEPLTFEKAFPPRYFDNCKKIGEGLYGEVFYCQYNCTAGRVLKIIPIEGHILVNGEKQKKYNEVLSELVIAMELSNLRHDAQFKTGCFVEVARCICVQGRYPQRLIDLWNEYHEEKVSENDSPTIFDDRQLFLIFELADGGKALEAYCYTSAAQALSAFVQLTFALAVAETTLEFEHRDLHWGNVLINKTSAKHIAFKFSGNECLVPSNGIQVTIIDYTLSRMTFSGCCIFNDMSVDPDLFISQGDYQFEVYRLMKNTVKNDWHNFRPYTNILWLHYILDKMLCGVHYKNISTKIHKKCKTKLTNCYNDVLKYNSAYELVTSGNLLEIMK